MTTEPLNIHYHHASLVWILFLIGEALHIWLQTASLAQKSKVSVLGILKANAPQLAFRTFFCCLVFGLIWRDPAILAQVTKIFGVSLGPDEAAVFAVPMNNAIAGVYGLFLDSAFGYIPFLKSQLPSVEQSVTVTQTATLTTKTSTVSTPQEPPTA